MPYKVGYFIGSLSSSSINRELSKVLIRLAPDDLEFTEIPIGNLPLYSPDYDADYPPEATALKEAIAACVLSFCNARQMTSPEAYIQFAPEKFGPAARFSTCRPRTSCRPSCPSSANTWCASLQ